VKLPQGLIHGDLFKDNVLFNHGQLSGILDFYNARHDSWLVDLAITANAWSHSQNGEINRDTLNSLLESYQQIRTLTTLELQLLPVMLRASALRFWLSRLEHQLFPRTGQLTQEKDPRLYRYILEQHQVWKHQF
jgi:homoserine kinase type II